MNSKTKIRLAVIPAAIVTAALTIAVAALGVKLTNKKQTHSTFPAPLVNKIPGFPFIINPDDHQPQPTYKAAKEPWHQQLIIDNIDVPQIKRTIHKLWGLDINDFEWCVEEHRFEHYGLALDTAYQLWFDDWCTIFYYRIHTNFSGLN